MRNANTACLSDRWAPVLLLDGSRQERLPGRLKTAREAVAAAVQFGSHRPDAIGFSACQARPRQLVQVESSCAPHAEAGDLLELDNGSAFAGDGLYALEYLREGVKAWSGLRQVRQSKFGLEVEEGTGWTLIGEAPGAALCFIGRVVRVFRSSSAMVAGAEPFGLEG